MKILIADGRASGVELRNKRGIRTVAANREIILSAGAIKTPKLLQLSGIGPAPLLRSLGIEVVRDAAQVGENLREHRHLDLQFRVRDGSQNKNLGGWRLIPSVLRYVATAKGPMTHCVHEIGGFVKTSAGLPHADMQFNLISVWTTALPGDGKVALEKKPGVTFLGYYTRPKSQGVVRIQSADPDARPYINARHFEHPADRAKAVAVVRWMRKLARQPALKDWIVEEIAPGSEVSSEEQILERAVALGGSCFHISGTARMGADPEAVVDPRLRVKGIKGLRVADTSIMPTLVSGNTNGPAMMIGWRAASFILEEGQGASLR